MIGEKSVRNNLTTGEGCNGVHELPETLSFTGFHEHLSVDNARHDVVVGGALFFDSRHSHSLAPRCMGRATLRPSIPLKQSAPLISGRKLEKNALRTEWPDGTGRFA